MFENLPPHVDVFEVGPRDGLQNEVKQVSTADKVRLIEALAGSGLSHIEITSFVSAKWIPQLSDGLAVAQSVKLPKNVTASALVPNQKGYEAAKSAGVSEIAFFMSATESHSKKNINKTISEAISTLQEVSRLAKQDKKKVRVYLSVVFGCPYEGDVPIAKVANICQELAAIGVDQIALSDTIGAAHPKSVLSVIERVQDVAEKKKLALHFHDTRGTALANVLSGLEAGITTFDASIGGMGGCPYAPGAAGNLATEDLVYLLHNLGIDTGVDLSKLIACGKLAEEIIGRQLPGRYLRAVLASKNATNIPSKTESLKSEAKSQ